MGCIGLASNGSAASAEPELAETATSLGELPVLESRLARVSARDDSKYAMGAIQQAKRAIAKASAPGQDPAVAARSVEVARAALVLSERQLDLRRAQEELFETQRRLTATKERATSQRRVLEALLQERAALAREAEEP